MKDEKQKEKYDEARLDIVLLRGADIITTSPPTGDDVADDDWT